MILFPAPRSMLGHSLATAATPCRRARLQFAVAGLRARAPGVSSTVVRALILPPHARTPTHVPHVWTATSMLSPLSQRRMVALSTIPPKYRTLTIGSGKYRPCPTFQPRACKPPFSLRTSARVNPSSATPPRPTAYGTTPRATKCLRSTRSTFSSAVAVGAVALTVSADVLPTVVAVAKDVNVAAAFTMAGPGEL